MSILTPKVNGFEQDLPNVSIKKLNLSDIMDHSGYSLSPSDAKNDATAAVCSITNKDEQVNSISLENGTLCNSVPEGDTMLLTETMIQEEKQLHDKGVIENDKMTKKALEDWTNISKDVRLTQLNHLLEKSNIYANYLLDVIETSKKREEKRAMRREKKQKTAKLSKNKVKQTSENNAKRKPKKRKLSDEEFPTTKVAKTTAKAEYELNDKIVVSKVNKDGEEDLVEAKVVDLQLVGKKWKYKVHYMGFSKKKDNWITKEAIAEDISNKEVSSDSDDDSHNSVKKLDSAIARLDKKALFEAKFKSGIEPSSSYSVVDEVRYFNGQEISPIQPDLLTGGILRDYQITGFQWLKVLFDNAVNGILADEMGLGKTIQSIAMVCRLVKTGFHGPFLVCAPLSTVCNWILEFRKFAPQIPVLLYHGLQAERSVLQSCIGKRTSPLSCCPVVVTSYEVFMRDRPSFAKFSWDYLIIDEGHRIKNMNCRLVKELKRLKVTAKVLLTGTPLQNNLAELWSLLNFLLPEVFNDLSTFEAWFDLEEIQKGAKVGSSVKEENIVVMLHKILAPFLLRRTKNDIDILLPSKRELIVFTPLAASQNDLYQAVANRTIRKLLLNKDDKENGCCVADIAALSDNMNGEGFEGKLTRSATKEARLAGEKKRRNDYDTDSVINVSLNNLMMQLRKCTNHPYLLEYPLIPGTDMYRIDEEIISSCGKMQLLDRMLPVLKDSNHRVLIFSQMTKILDILQDYCHFRNFGFFRLDGSTKCDVRQQYIDQFNNDPDSFLFLLSTRAGGLGINLTAADTVIIYDSDWNPQNDLQAQDRCHRIGQTKPVIVYRFVAANTVDQFLVQRAEAKRVLERLIINRSKFKGELAEDLKSDKSSSVESVTLLSMLQKSKTSDVSVKPINDTELNKILDRETVMNCSNEDLTCGIFQSIE